MRKQLRYSSCAPSLRVVLAMAFVVICAMHAVSVQGGRATGYGAAAFDPLNPGSKPSTPPGQPYTGGPYTDRPYTGGPYTGRPYTGRECRSRYQCRPPATAP